MAKIMSEEQTEYIAKSLDDGDIETRAVEHRNPSEQLGFASMPHIIGLDTKLSDGAYRTYGILKYFSQRHEWAIPSVETLAVLRGVTEPTIKRHLKELIDRKLIGRSRRMGTSSITYIEEIPKEYLDAARAILEKRKTDKREKTYQKRYARGIKNDTNVGSTNDPKRITSEGEQVKDIPPAAENETLKNNAAELWQDIEDHSASKDMPPRKSYPSPALACPRLEAQSDATHYAEQFAAILAQEPIKEHQTAAAKMLQQKWFRENRKAVDKRLRAYRNGDGEQFRKPGASAWFIFSQLQRDLASGLGKAKTLTVTI